MGAFRGCRTVAVLLSAFIGTASERGAGPILTPQQAQAGTQEGRKCKTADKFFDKGLKGKPVELLAMACLDRRPPKTESSRWAGRVQLVASAHESLTQIDWQRIGIAPRFRPLLVLADQVSVDVSLVCEVVGDGAVDLFKPKKLEFLANRLRRLAAAE
jgi:hypothetical protein